MSSERSPLTVSDLRREEEEKKLRRRDRIFLNRAVDKAYNHHSRGAVTELGPILEAIIDLLEIKEWMIRHIAGKVPQNHTFYAYELSTFIRAIKYTDDPHKALTYVAEQSTGITTSIAAGGRILESLVSAAAAYGLLREELQQVQPVYGYQMEIGERYVRADSQARGDLELRDTEDELKSILCAGGKGSGKSTAVETLVHDSYQNGHKIVDVVDFFKAENAVYDIPQQDNGEGLIEARESIGLPVGFDDLEAGLAWLDGEPDPDLTLSPDLEVMIPMCPGLGEMDVPAINGEKPTVKPFTIPASEMTYRQLVMLLHHTTEARENEIRSAHQKLRDSGQDWTLSDLAAEIWRSTNASNRLAEDIETSLQTAQEKSFIRDKACPYALDWEEEMADEETITAITVHPVQETSDHKVILSYLIDSLFEARKKLLTKQRLADFPPLTVVMREMHEVAPRSTSEQSAESTVENYMVDSLGDMFALTRHANMEVIADTQKFHRQLDPDVSGLFDHILAFQGHIPDVKKIFKTRVDNTGPAETVAQYTAPGRCAFVSEDGYAMPIQLAPPPSHHLEAKSEGNGLGFRTRVPGSSEKLIESPWNSSIPPRLTFGRTPDHPVDEFLDEYVDYTGKDDDYETVEAITAAYNEWAAEKGHGEYSNTQIGTRLVKVFDNLGDHTKKRPEIDGRRLSAHSQITLTW